MSPLITGVGLNTPLGGSSIQTWNALFAGKYITSHSQAKIDSPNQRSRVSQLAIEAAREAIDDAKWSTFDNVAIVVGTSKGPIEDWLNGKFDGRGLSAIADDLADCFGIADCPRLTLSAACASGLHALIRASLMIRSGQVTRAIVVAAEASVHPLFLGSFQRLGVLSPEGIPCRPFDFNRQGFLMSEAAAAVCLEAPGVSKNGKPYATVDRFAMGGDAIHLTAGDPRGTTLQRLLQSVINNQAVDLIHAHGTGTVMNDAIEVNAIERVLQDGHGQHPFVYSHKAALGHSLGASGLISIVVNCLCHRHRTIPGNVNTTEPIPMKNAVIRGISVNHDVRRSLICASGFGGPVVVASLVSD